MSFRGGTSADLEAVVSWVRNRRECELWAGSRFEFPLDLGALPAQLRMDTAESVCVLDGQELMAFGQLFPKSPERVHLTRVIVKPSARRRGFGRALVCELLRRAEGRYALASLSVNRGNPAAIALYESLGFRRADRPVDDPPSPGSWYMELSLDRRATAHDDLTDALNDGPKNDLNDGPKSDLNDDSHADLNDDSHADLNDYLRRVTIGALEQPDIVVVDYDPAWPGRFAEHEATIRAALGERARLVEHVGSTAVPGLAAKPIIDVLLVVDDPADEPSYLPALEAVGYALRVREPDFYEHRMLRTPARDLHLHVFAADSPEVERYLLLRDRLRRDDADRELYAATKRRLAARRWSTMQHYAEAKSAVIEAIMARARDEEGARR
jgi:GrpB-like predicted nucleotidyltransferase (UPF0157 family)/ribosomal protein S18 acetylase RimI-like enzyme